jgi:hypothetical protein
MKTIINIEWWRPMMDVNFIHTFVVLKFIDIDEINDGNFSEVKKGFFSFWAKHEKYPKNSFMMKFFFSQINQN